MAIVVDPEFSVYGLVERVRKNSTLASHRRSMSIMSYEIENATLIHHAKTRIFSSFQRMSRFVPQMQRYQEMAKYAEHIYVFGIPDVALDPIDNITYIPLQPTDQLAKEWFVVSHGLEYYSILATEEQTAITDPDATRMFQGLWSFDLDIVSIIEEWLSSAVDARPLNYTPDQYQSKRQNEIMSGIVQRLLARPEFMNPRPLDYVVQGQIKTALKEQVQPDLPQLQDFKTDGGMTEAVIFFSDIRGFSTMSEHLSPREMVARIINPYITVVSQAIQQHSGTIDKFLGDGILAIFTGEDEAILAAQQALENLHQMYPELPIGIGITRGEVLLSELGTTGYREYSMIGEAVNRAQRLSSLGANGMWVCDKVQAKVGTKYPLQNLGNVSLKGLNIAHEVYEWKPLLGY